MCRVLALGLLAISSCGVAPSTSNPADDYSNLNPCISASLDDPAFRKRMELDREIFDRAEKGEASAAAEAAIAIKKGDFRFFAYSRIVPGIFPAAYGVECRPELVTQNAPGYFRGIFAASDVSSDEVLRTERLFEQRYSAFATAYNRAVLKDARYPWRDICRAVDQPSQFRLNGEPAVKGYGYRDLQETASPIDLGEAARRGTLESVERLAIADSSAVNRADAFGLTPLAWAVVYHRGDHARALLKHGAAPSGSPCQRLSTPTSPMQFARALQWREMIDQMRPHMKNAPYVVLHDPPMLLSKPPLHELSRGIEQSQKRYAGKLASETPVTAKVSLDQKGKALDCKLDPKTGIKAFDQEICSQVLTTTRWKAARGEYGEPVAGEGIIRLRIRSPEY
jgi:hypothetical protein